MRGERQLILIVLVLVAGPTAILSFLAARTLRNWDAVMERQLAVTAQRDLLAIAAELQTPLAGLRRQLVQSATEAVVSGNPAEALLDTAAGLTRADSLADWIFVYRPSAGMVYPPPDRGAAGPASDAAEPFPARGSEEVPVAVEEAQRLQFAGALPSAMDRYAAILSRPALPRRLHCAALLGLAQSRRQAGRPAAAIDTLQTLLALATPDPDLRDGEGNRIALTARRELVEAYRQGQRYQAARGNVLLLMEELAIRYADLIPDQRQSLRFYLAEIECDPAASGAGASEASGEGEFQRRMQRARIRLEEQARNLDVRGTERKALTEFLSVKFPPGAAPSHSTRFVLQNRRWVVASMDTADGKPESFAGTTPTGGDWTVGFRLNPVRLQSALHAAIVRRGGMQDLQFTVKTAPADLPIGHRGAATERYLAELELPAPLDGIALAARPTDANALRTSAGLQARLYLWGIFLLAGTVALGIWAAVHQATREIRRARTRSDFVAGVSHDLRTPLASMRMLAESLYLGHIEDPTMQKTFLSAILKECDRLGQLTERAFYFVRLGQDSLRFHREPGDLCALVQEAAESFRVRFREGERKITVTADAELPAVLLDNSAIAQVVHNLIENAVKYSPEGSGIEVRLGPGPGHREVFFEVRDHGIGIERRDRRRIFRRFVRGRDPRVLATRGAGLGLALCRLIVQAHQGRIEMSAPADGGSLFRVVLKGMEEEA